jgi:hypothetical protein
LSSRQIQIAIAGLALAMMAIGFYAYRLLEREERPPAVRVSAIPATSGPGEQVTLMLGSSGGPGLRPRKVRASSLPADPGPRAQEVVRLLLRAYAAKGSGHPLPAEAEVKQVFVVEDTAVLDMNAAFSEKHPSGIAAEQLTLDSLAQTLKANLPQIKRIKVLIEGKERRTLAGHVALDWFVEAGEAAEGADRK